MNLTPKERERLTIFNAAELARRRKARGVPLNHPEAVAYVADWVCEGAREGKSVATLREQATQLLSREDVMEGVPELIDTVQVEPVFPDGTKLVTVHDPIRADSADQLDDVPSYDRLPRADAVPDGGRDPATVDADCGAASVDADCGAANVDADCGTANVDADCSAGAPTEEDST